MPHKEPGYGMCVRCERTRALRRRGLCYSCWEQDRQQRTPQPQGPRGVCQACGGPVSGRGIRYCWACYTARRRDGLVCDPHPQPVADPPGPAMCATCGQWFSTWMVRSAHTYWLTPRCLTAAELAARGWRQTPFGWAFPLPESPERTAAYRAQRQARKEQQS